MSWASFRLWEERRAFDQHKELETVISIQQWSSPFQDTTILKISNRSRVTAFLTWQGERMPDSLVRSKLIYQGALGAPMLLKRGGASLTFQPKNVWQGKGIKGMGRYYLIFLGTQSKGSPLPTTEFGEDFTQEQVVVCEWW
ncbi:MAG: hypothetical protein AAF399_21485 [Bacteroidota bacterium]